MRLINTRTLELLVFTDNEIPEYAILSHTWGAEEVTQQDLLALTPSIKTKAGFEKISRFCERAANDGHEFAWIDTCCIDKTSSAELSEAINSMYNWYSRAEICYAFLADVPMSTALDGEHSAFAKSRWFTRGWTLQELLAPLHLVFYSAEWLLLGTKIDLSGKISQATGIDTDILNGETDLQTASIACRMSWAAHRTTTRVEDMAYCLMGLFDVNMPMLYGEGQKAFIRLQEEIIRSTEDHTIFAWEDPDAPDDQLRGLLAPYPRCFQTTGNFQPVLASEPKANLVNVTNRGIYLRVLHYTTDTEGPIAILNCTESNATNSFAYIHLQSLDKAGSKSARIRSRHLGKSPRRGLPRTIVVSQKPRLPTPPKPLKGHQWFTINKLTFPQRITWGGDHLAFFTVSEHSAIRPLKPDTNQPSSTETQPTTPTTRITGSPSNHLFQIPHHPNQLALTLHISASDSMGFGNAHHAKIDIGVQSGVTFAITAANVGESDDEYQDRDNESQLSLERFAKAARPLPATVKFELEDPVKAVAAVAWRDIDGMTVACISIDIDDDKD